VGQRQREIKDARFALRLTRRRKKSCTGDGADGNDDGFSVSNIMGMMMVQQRSEQSSTDADCMAREVKLSLRQEEIAMHRKEITSQLQIQHKESCAHQQNDERHADGDDAKHRRDQSSAEDGHRGTNEHQRTEIGGNNQQEPISGTNQQNNKNNE